MPADQLTEIARGEAAQLGHLGEGLDRARVRALKAPAVAGPPPRTPHQNAPRLFNGPSKPVVCTSPERRMAALIDVFGTDKERRGRPGPIQLAGLPCERPSRMNARTCLMGSVGVKVSGSALGSQKAPKARLPGVTRATSLSRAGEPAWLPVIAICQFNQRVDVIGRNRPAIQGAEGA